MTSSNELESEVASLMSQLSNEVVSSKAASRLMDHKKTYPDLFESEFIYSHFYRLVHTVYFPAEQLTFLFQLFDLEEPSLAQFLQNDAKKQTSLAFSMKHSVLSPKIQSDHGSLLDQALPC